MTAARIDETAVDPEALLGGARASAAAVGAIVGIGILWKFLLPLISRVGSGDALDHPRRKALYAYVLDHPGATLREVMQASDLAAGTARHHLGILTRSKLLVEHKHRSTLRYFENHGRFDQVWHSHVLLREGPLSKLHELLVEQGDKIQREILDHAEASWGWSRSTTQHRLLRLEEANLVSVRQQGRRKVYGAVDAETAQRLVEGTPRHGLGYSVRADGMPAR